MNPRKILTFLIFFLPTLPFLSACSLFLVATEKMSDKDLESCATHAKIKENRTNCLDSYIDRKAIKEPEVKTDNDNYVAIGQGKNHFDINANKIFIYHVDKDNVYGWISKSSNNGSTMSKFILSCKSKTFLEKENKKFKTNGNISSLTNNNSTLKTIEPGTVSETLYNKVCYAQ